LDFLDLVHLFSDKLVNETDRGRHGRGCMGNIGHKFTCDFQGACLDFFQGRSRFRIGADLDQLIDLSCLIQRFLRNLALLANTFTQKSEVALRCHEISPAIEKNIVDLVIPGHGYDAKRGLPWVSALDVPRTVGCGIPTDCLVEVSVAASGGPGKPLACRRRIGENVPQATCRRNAMAYNLDQFVTDCRAALARDPGPKGREEVRVGLERLLRDQDFLNRYCGDDAPQGLTVLHEDKSLGFQILAHINDKARASPPHDHGASWAIYGQATKYTDMTEWERIDEGSDAAHAELKPVKTYRLLPGQAGIYQDGKIHSIDYPDKARFIRVTGTNLDRIPRVRFDLATGAVHQMTPQQAT
jgi:hypothetical protein